jgi:exodeoxyribonuclease VII large subunit
MKTAPITLEILNKKIKGLIKEGLDSYWVIAEISELTINYSGHCYLELVQKSEKNEQLIARARAVIWANTFRMIQPYFESTTGHTFTEGIKVMVRVVVEFHEVYGLSLNVVDIEPTYTVGELTVRKQKILEKLNAEGVLEMNRDLELPYHLNRIATISSKTAAGLGDFMNQLNNNPHGFKFYTKLFAATMQGNEAESSIISQLDIIFRNSSLFDVVVIIRGGGASADLECFNSYWLAYNITQFPIPVLTGIGHEQDDTVVDVVANTRLKTPTAVAEFLIDKMVAVENDLLMLEEEISDRVQLILRDKKQELNQSAYNLQKHYNFQVKHENKKLNKLSIRYVSGIKNCIHQHQRLLQNSSSKLSISGNIFLNTKNHILQLHQAKLSNRIKIGLTINKHQIEKAEQSILYNNPNNILSRGYSISLKDGKCVKDGTKLQKGDIIETVFYKGKKQSEIK